MNKLFLILSFYLVHLCAASKYTHDTSAQISLAERNNSSHLNVYISSLPYGYIMRLINGTLVRLDDSQQGWEYYIAYKHQKINNTTYDFWLRNDIKFQDGTPLDADIVVYNFEQFLKGAFTFTDIHNKLTSVEKIDKYRIRLHLKEPYGLLMNDLTRINLYTKKYYKIYGWNKSVIGENTSGPGPYGAGPYILVEGHATGLSQSDKVELVANPFYFEEGKPYINHLTIYTRKPIDQVIDELANQEGKMDIAFIPFNKKTEIVNSKYAKLFVAPSEATLSFNINLMNPNTPLHDIRIRQALNQALDQAKLVKFAYKGEGVVSPFPVSANTISAKNLSQEYAQHPPYHLSEQELKSALNGLTLKVITQDKLLSICKGVEYQLKAYGVNFIYDITTDEKYVFKKLLTNRSKHYDWDLLLWGNEDWARHPWSSMFALYTRNQWSSIDHDDTLDDYIQTMFTIEKEDERFTPLIETILKHVYQKAYMLSIPSPNTVIGFNKEVDFIPTSGYILRLWEAKITPYHWSIRGDKPLPHDRLYYQLPKRLHPNE